MSTVINPSYDVIDELLHAGVKGMKWGVRKDPKSQQRHDDKMTMRKQTKEAHKERMSVHRMSNEDIQKKVKRMQLEKQYLSLTEDRAAYHQSVGKKMMKKMLGIGVQKGMETGAQAMVKKGGSLATSGATKAATAANPQVQAALLAAQAMRKKRGG